MTDARLFDLNLLADFEALLLERSVTRAAARRGIGQPAMSHVLKRLRDVFDDALFVRTPTGMEPTVRALELAEPIARILADVRIGVLARRDFHPESERRTFRIAASDYAEVSVLSPLLPKLRAEAPYVQLALSVTARDRVSAELESGAIDMAIGYFPDVAGAVSNVLLYREDFVCLFDEQACGVAAPISLESFIDLPHLLMSLSGEGFGSFDEVLARIGRKRLVAFATPHFLTLPFALHGLRAIASVPRRLAERCSSVTGLAVSPLPFAAPGFNVSLLWHARTDKDPGHAWLRTLILQIALQSELPGG